jgi:hypothetical protein
MVDTLAVAALTGVPVRRIIEGDDVERALWLRVTERAGELHVQHMRAHASHVGAAVARSFR